MWIPMALSTLTNHCSTTVLAKRHSREIIYQAKTNDLSLLVSVFQCKVIIRRPSARFSCPLEIFLNTALNI